MPGKKSSSGYKYSKTAKNKGKTKTKKTTKGKK